MQSVSGLGQRDRDDRTYRGFPFDPCTLLGHAYRTECVVKPDGADMIHQTWTKLPLNTHLSSDFYLYCSQDACLG